MNYYIKRGDQEYGPYPLSLLQQYVAQGNIARDDLARSEGITDWVPVSTILGNVPVPTAAAFGAQPAPAPAGPLPPGLHWGWVVGLGIITFGIFWVVWIFAQAAWIRRVLPQSQAIIYLIAYVVASFSSGIFDKSLNGLGPILSIAGLVLYLIGIFKMRSDIDEYYATVSPPGPGLSGVMTFFFNCAYFQYHLRDLRQIMENSARAATSQSNSAAYGNFGAAN